MEDRMSVSRSERGVRRQSTGRRNDWKAKQMGVRISELEDGRFGDPASLFELCRDKWVIEDRRNAEGVKRKL